MTPQYVHDCDNCKLLGQYERFDLYFCDTKCKDDQSVVARYGDLASHYSSTLVELTRRLSDVQLGSAAYALRIATLTAEDLGYLTKIKESNSKGWRILNTVDTTISKVYNNEREALREGCKGCDVIDCADCIIEIVQVRYNRE